MRQGLLGGSAYSWCSKRSRFTIPATRKTVASFTPSRSLELPEHIPLELLELETAPTPDLTTKTVSTLDT